MDNIDGCFCIIPKLTHINIRTYIYTNDAMTKMHSISEFSIGIELDLAWLPEMGVRKIDILTFCNRQKQIGFHAKFIALSSV